MSIDWKDSYKIGDSLIDEQHQHLFLLANNILSASGKDALTLCALQFYKYTRAHFAHEEALMRQVNFPGYKEHVEWHIRLITRLNETSLQIKNGTLDKQSLEAFISDWALKHIPLFDAPLAAYLVGRLKDDATV